MAIFPLATPEQLAPSSPSTAASQAQQPVTIPLDQPEAVVHKSGTVDGQDDTATAPRRTPVRRDSMRRREALIKGKEGSRRRQRWENDNFLNHPGYAPPTPDDFQPGALYPTRIVRYEFATLWDPSNPAKYGVPKNLKDRLKRSKGAMDLLKSLEEEVRRYAASLWGCIDEHYQSVEAKGRWQEEEEEEKQLEKSISMEEDGMKDSEDEEIVFIPRMKMVTINEEKKNKGKEVYIPVLGPALQKSVFEAPQEDPRASFGRWLVHSIALYYGLSSWSVTEGNPAMRIAFVGAQPSEKKKRKSGVMVKHPKTLPRPLWMLL